MHATSKASRRGFTLIELLIVVVIIGILAAVAIPKYAATKGSATVAKMKSDLRNLSTAQEAYFSDNTQYYGGGLPSSELVYAPSPGIAVTITEATATGWSATSGTIATPRQCALISGDAAPVAPATIEGVIACTAS